MRLQSELELKSLDLDGFQTRTRLICFVETDNENTSLQLNPNDVEQAINNQMYLMPDFNIETAFDQIVAPGLCEKLRIARVWPARDIQIADGERLPSADLK